MNKHLLFAAGLALLAPPAFAQGSPAQARNQATAAYNPIINAADFSPVISNKYYTLNPGMKAGYEQATSKGIKRMQIDVAGDTKTVMGITTLVVQHREWLNGWLMEDARGWFAQDKHGNVWYFGEAVEAYKGGKLVKGDDSWEAGVEGAKPGILMFGDPKPATTYRREYHPGRAEDMATVVAVGIRVRLPQGPLFQNCVHMREWSPLKKGEIENKYYCVGIGAMVLMQEGADRLKLVTFKKSLESESLPTWRTASAR
jgi:hypothetical protein